jgi:hypothetical protein
VRFKGRYLPAIEVKDPKVQGKRLDFSDYQRG